MARVAKSNGLAHVLSPWSVLQAIAALSRYVPDCQSKLEARPTRDVFGGLVDVDNIGKLLSVTIRAKRSSLTPVRSH